LRTTTLPTGLLGSTVLGLALLAPAGPASAVETCQGQRVTLVGTDSQPLLGTEGPDVIATNGASRVDSLGGDDLVCVTGAASGLPPGRTRAVEVDSGEGNDRVEATTEGWSTFVELGLGADTFVASSIAEHVVVTGYAIDRSSTDTEADVVRIAAGTARVTTGQTHRDNPDVVEITRGEVFWSGRQVAPGSVTASTDGELHVHATSAAVDLDARAGTMTSSDTSLAFSGFTDFGVGVAARKGRFSFRGSHRDERLTFLGRDTYDRYVVMGGGDDDYVSDSLGANNSWVRGSGGRDSLTLIMPGHDVHADMWRSRVVTTAGGRRNVARTGSFEELRLAARHAEVDGTRHDDTIVVAACRAVVSAAAGQDVVAFTGGISWDAWTAPDCSSRHAVGHGGRGDDTLLGGPGNDRLIGGRGIDLVKGRGGRDVCQGEQRRTCEARTRG
jgi:Ca2+-binding RTX toxin-like protein